MFVGLFALFLGIAFIYVGWSYVSLARRMRHFRSAPGKVVAREVVVVPSGNTTTGAFGDGGGYMPSVRYRYAVDGKELEGNKIAFANAGYKRAIAERKLGEIPSDVVVWYDPEKTSEAYLQKHTPTMGIVLLIFGVSVSLGALLKVVMAVRG